MFEFKKKQDGTKLTYELSGRLDTTTAPALDNELHVSLDGITALDFDISGLEYVSSAGLRVFLAAQKIMNKQGEMAVRGVSEEVMEVFEVTGFTGILNIEK